MRATIGIAIDSNCPVLLRLPGFGFSRSCVFARSNAVEFGRERGDTTREKRDIASLPPPPPPSQAIVTNPRLVLTISLSNVPGRVAFMTSFEVPQQPLFPLHEFNHTVVVVETFTASGGRGTSRNYEVRLRTVPHD